MTVVDTSTSISPRGKRAHDGVLLLGRSRPCSTSIRQPGQGRAPRARRGVHGVHALARLARASAASRRPSRARRPSGSVRVGVLAGRIVVVTDARAHDVGLAPLAHLLGHPLPGALPPSAGLSAGTTWVVIGDRPAGSSRRVEVSMSPNTVIATVRGIGVAVMTSTCGGTVALAAQRIPLLDPEPVLLVDDHEARGRGTATCSWISACVPIDDAGVAGDDVEQRLRRRSAVDWLPVSSATRVPMLGAAEHAALGEVAEHRGDRAVVLRGEHLGRGEQRGLAAGVDGREHRAQRDDGLARADLALQQPVHRARRGPAPPRGSAPTSRWPAVSSNGSRASNAASRPPGRGGRGVVAAPRCSCAGAARGSPAGRTPPRSAAAAGPPSTSAIDVGPVDAAQRLGARHERRAGARTSAGSGVGDVVERRRARCRTLSVTVQVCMRADRAVDRDRRPCRAAAVAVARRRAARSPGGSAASALVVACRPCRRRCPRAPGTQRAPRGPTP